MPRGLGTSPGRRLKESAFLSALRFRRPGRNPRAWGSLCVRASVREVYCLVHGSSSTEEARRSCVSQHLDLLLRKQRGEPRPPASAVDRCERGCAPGGALVPARAQDEHLPSGRALLPWPRAWRKARPLGRMKLPHGGPAAGAAAVSPVQDPRRREGTAPPPEGGLSRGSRGHTWRLSGPRSLWVFPEQTEMRCSPLRIFLSRRSTGHPQRRGHPLRRGF